MTYLATTAVICLIAWIANSAVKTHQQRDQDETC